MLIITHNLGVVARYADRVNVMYAGEIVERGTGARALRPPAPPLHARPPPVGPAPGRAPAGAPRPDRRPAARPDAPAPGLRLHPRCAFRVERCLAERPPLEPVGRRRPPERRAGRSTPAGTPGRGVRDPPVSGERPRPTHRGGPGRRLLEVRDLVKHFPCRRRALRPPGGARPGGGRRELHDPARRDARPGRGVGLRQDDDRPLHPPARAADERRSVLFEGQELTTPRRRRAAPGPRAAIQVIFQDPYSSLNPRMTVGQILAEPLAVHRLVPDARRAGGPGPGAPPATSGSSPSTPGATPTSCRAASASGSASRGRSRWSRP